MKLKKLLALLLSVCMLMTAFAAYASEAVEPEYMFSSVAFTYHGEEAKALEGGETLTATVTAVDNTASGNSLTFALIVSKNGKVIAADNDTMSVSGEETFEVEVMLPDDVAGVEAKAVLWEGFGNMKPLLAEALMPSSNADLTYISVDGAKLEGFDPAVTDYTYLVEDPARMDIPVIKVKTANSASKVDIAAPQWYPGKSVITVTAPDGTKKEYTVKYKVEDAPFVSNVRILEDNTLPSGAPVQMKSEYIWNGVKEGNICYDDRPVYYMTEISGESLLDASIITMNNDWMNGAGKIPEECALFRGTTPYKWVQFEVSRGLTVRYFHDKAAVPGNLTSMGYTQETTTDYIVGNTTKHAVVYSRHFNAGETAYIPNSCGGGVSPIAVISHDPFGSTSSSLSQITVDGSVIDGFDSNKFDYTYELSADTLIAPTVEAFAIDDRSHVSITAPDSFPGKAVISVTAPGCETATYTITYTCTSPLADNIVGDPDVTTWTTHNGNTHNNRSELPAIYHDLQVGNTNLVHDRIQANGAAVVVDESLLGRDYISAGHDWHSGSPNGDFDEVYKDSSGLNSDWYSFDLHRSADVKVIFKTDPYSTTIGSSISDLQIMNGNELPDGTAIDASKHVKYLEGGFKAGCQHVADRTFTLSNIKDTDLFGSDMIFWAYESYKDGDAVQDYVVANHNVDDTPGIVNWINFTVNRDAEIYVYTSLPKGQQTDNDRALEAAGFEHVSEAGTTYATSSVAIANNTYSGKWKKTVSAGETVNLPSNRSGSAQGRVTPFAVIKYTSDLPLLPEEDIVPLNNGFIAEYLKSQGYKFQHKDSGYFIQAFTPCGKANCDGMYSKHFEVANGETVTVSMPSFVDREFFVVLDYAGIQGEDYDNGIVIDEDKISTDIVKIKGDFPQGEASVDGYAISDAEGTLTVNVTANPGDSLGFALVKPDMEYKESFKDRELAETFVILTQSTVPENGSVSYVVDMTDEDSGYYIPVINGVVQNGKIFFATSQDRAEMYEEIKDILDGKDIAEGETIQTTLIKKLDSANEESLAINVMSVTTNGLATIDTATYAKAIIALYNEDNSLVTNADTLKVLMEDAALIALVDEGKEDIADITSTAGLEAKYVSLYEDELSKETKASFSSDYFAGKGYYTKEALAKAYNEAVILSFVNDINAQSDAEKLILQFGEDIGIDADEYEDLGTKQKNNIKDYITDDLGTVTDIANMVKKINDEIKDEADSSSGGGGSRGGSGGGGGSTGGAGAFAGSEPIVAVTPEQQTEGFSDMAGFSWAEDAVNALADRGVVSGIGGNMFAPANAVTREEMLTMLLRAYNVDVTGAVSAFKDVPANAWYNAYVAKGFELGVTSGVDSENFGSGRPVTRQEAAAMAYRIATYFGGTFTPETAVFADDSSIADWAKEAIYALKGSSVINGIGDGNFAPSKGCTRAEAAMIVYGLINR